MGEERTLYDSETERTIPEVMAFLQELMHWLGDRRFIIDRGEETIVIEIPDEVVLEIEIEEEFEGENRVKRSLEIEIEWVEEKEADAASNGEE